MRILWLSAGLLLPLDKGGKLRTWHLMRHLARAHEITCLSFAEPDTPAALRDGMLEVCSSLHTVPRRDAEKGTFAFYADVASSLIDRLPYAVGKYRSAAYAEKLREVLAQDAFDLLVCDFLVPAVNMPDALPCPAVLFTHNVEADIWRRHVEQQPNAAARWLYRRQWQRMLRFEAETLARFDLVLAVSEQDKETLQRLYGERLHAPIFTVATGVDTEYFAPRSLTPSPHHLVFTGSMDWLPNADAMTYFCRDVLPLIRAQEPGTSLSIVGRSPTPAVRRLADMPGVEVTGRVDDVRGYIERASVYIVPLRIGGGTRLKIFEAMAMGRAVVSTTIGAEGLPVVDGEHVYIADTPHDFARAVLSLMHDPARRVQLERAARDLVVRAYDWSAVAGELDDALRHAAQSSAAAA